MESKKIINKTQLDTLVASGILYKDSDDCYRPIIDRDRWSDICMPSSMAYDVVNKILKLTKNAFGWTTVTERGTWCIAPWMLEENYAELIKHGKYRPEPYAVNPDSFGLYKLKIMDLVHLEHLENKGILSRKIKDGVLCYTPNIDGMGDVSMSFTMAEHVCGKVLSCKGTVSSWVDFETGYLWNIAPWMLADNYDYLLERLKGTPNTSLLEPEDDEEEEEEVNTRNYVDIVGKITDKTDSTILVSTEYTDVLVHVTYAPGVGHKVNVEGYLMRTSNMMGYPEVNCTSIQEV